MDTKLFLFLLWVHADREVTSPSHGTPPKKHHIGEFGPISKRWYLPLPKVLKSPLTPPGGTMEASMKTDPGSGGLPSRISRNTPHGPPPQPPLP